MLQTCLDCTRKHLSTAEPFLAELYAGYPEHRWLAGGELVHAERESADKYPRFAELVRTRRLLVMKSHASAVRVRVTDLIHLASVLAGEDDYKKYTDPNNSKVYDVAPEVQEYLDDIQRYGVEVASHIKLIGQDSWPVPLAKHSHAIPTALTDYAVLQMAGSNGSNHKEGPADGLVETKDGLYTSDGEKFLSRADLEDLDRTLFNK